MLHVFVLLCLSLAGAAQSDMFAVASTEGAITTRYLVLNVATGGLANRLRSIADWYHVAVITERTLLVSWRATPECNATFDSLFDVASMELDNFRLLPFTLEKGDTGCEYVKRMALQAGMTDPQVILADGSPQDFVLPEAIDDVLRSPSTSVVITSHTGIFTFSGTICTLYMRMRSRFLSSLVPVENTRKVLAQLKSQFFRNKLMVGVHIRWHDQNHDWEVVPPMLQDGDGQQKASALPFGSGASVDDFEKVMRQVLTKHQHPTKGESVRFLVTSNSLAVKERMLSRFGDSVVVMNGDLERSSSSGMDFAAAEFFALAQSDLVVHTYGSTFAEEAVQISGSPLVGIWNSASIYAQDTRLAHCGHMQFMNLASSSQAIPMSYTEGTTDRRNLDNPYYPIFTCPFLSEWGLKDVYCSLPEGRQ